MALLSLSEYRRVNPLLGAPMPSPPSNAHHMLRVRIRKRIFVRLQEIAELESADSPEPVSVSDIVRSALMDWIATHEASRQLANEVNRD